ncbi:MarR family transcriptional regulator [Gelidibacter sp. F2691]|nr:MarR family transcriptional regulator [Gelidibacter sp. F2691]
MTTQIQDRDPPEYHLSLVNQQIRVMMNVVLRRYDLKLVEWRVLQCLADEGALSVCDLSNRAVVERTATGRLVDRLVARGYVSKEQMPNDRRFSRICLQAEGQQKLSDCHSDIKDARARLFAGLSQSEIQQFLSVLLTLQRNMAAGRSSDTTLLEMAAHAKG